MKKLNHKKNVIILYTFILTSLVSFYSIANSVVVNKTIVQNTIPPSAIRTSDINDICTTKTSTIRNVSVATKKLVYKKAGVPYGDTKMCSAGWEVDHHHPLLNGGSNDISNLQLQAYCNFFELTKKSNTNIPVYSGLYDARKKDALEVNLHSKICKGKISIKDAQNILWNWKN